MKLRMLLLLSFMTLGLASARATDTAPFIEVWKCATGSCCGAWVKHLEANGFTVKVNAAEAGPLAALKREAGIGDKLASCHTAKIDDYVIEGHVPGTDIKRLIAERPEADRPYRFGDAGRLAWHSVFQLVLDTGRRRIRIASSMRTVGSDS